jgi:hypothetical protein
MDRVVRDYKLFSRVKLGLLGKSAQNHPCSVPIRLLHPLYSSFLWRRAKPMTRMMKSTEEGTS